jgi:HSP20 family protein
MAQQPQRTGETTPATPESGNPMMDLRRQVDQLFDDFAGTFGLPAFGFGFPTAAHARSSLADVRVEVSESQDRYEIAAEVPGMAEDDIDIDLSNDVLTIKGEKKAESEDTGKNYHVSERTYGRFQRSFRLPDTVDREKIDATFDRGLLKVHLPKRTEAKAQTRKINVKSA